MCRVVAGRRRAAAVAELDTEDFGELKLIGTVPMSPGVGGSRWSIPVRHRCADRPGTFPRLASCDGARGSPVANPAKLKLSEIFTPLGVEPVETTWNNQPVHHLNDMIARMFRLKARCSNRTR